MSINLATGQSGATALLILLLFVIFYGLSLAGQLRGNRPELRPLRGLQELPARLERYAEEGQSLHFSPGSGGLDGQTGSAETLSGLSSLAAVARLSARTSAGLVVSTNDSLTRQFTHDIARAEYARAGRLEDFDPASYRFIAQQDRLAFAAGAAEILRQEDVAASVMLGRLDAEYLLVAERANRRHLDQLAGTSRVEAMPLVLLSAGPDNALLGEEVFTAPAYLDTRPALLAGVVAQDHLRLALILLIIAGVIAAGLGLAPNVGDYFLR